MNTIKEILMLKTFWYMLAMTIQFVVSIIIGLYPLAIFLYVMYGIMLFILGQGKKHELIFIPFWWPLMIKEMYKFTRRNLN